MITYKLYKKEELYKKLIDSDYPTYMKDNGYISYVGMHYFNPNIFSSFSSNKEVFLVGETDKGEIVGVLHLSKNKLNDDLNPVQINFEEESNLDYIMVHFIDVHKEYRKQGIATQLYLELNKLITKPNQYVIGTGMSNQGKKANVHELRKKLVTNGKNFGDIYEFENMFMFQI